MNHAASPEAISLAFAIPFVGLLLSIAMFPLVAPGVWERHFPRVAGFWALAFLIPYGAINGADALLAAVIASTVHDYLPFIILLLSLFVVAGGIRIAGNIDGTPVTNLTILAIGTLAASLLGTTGASMLLIRPLIRANRRRRHKTHVFVFFIILVGNIGGALTPLGDPPLFMGFLRGVEFGWTMHNLAAPMGLASALLLGLFVIVDIVLWRREGPHQPYSGASGPLRIDGGRNILALGLIVAVVLVSGTWHSGVRVPLGYGITTSIENVLRDMALAVIALLSWRTTPATIRVENAFTWTPIREVAILFGGIFITIVPVLGALKLGGAGPFGPLLALISTPQGRPIESAYFWLSGGLSSVLDNAPTYMVFFDLAGGDPQRLMGPLARTLLAISMGSVFMGAVTYLGNAPNLMIKAICEERGVKMPGFFGYLVWSLPILMPLFALIDVIFLG